MVHYILGTPHPHVTSAIEDYISSASPRNHDEAGGFTSRRNKDWHELDPVKVGEPYYPTT